MLSFRADDRVNYARKTVVHDMIFVLKTVEENIQRKAAADSSQLKSDKFLKLNYRQMKDVYDKWVKEGSTYSLWLSVMYAVGCRKTAVVFREIVFRPLDSEESIRLNPPDRWINQIGVLKDADKRTGKVSARVVTKPILFETSTQQLIDRVETIRLNLQPELKKIQTEYERDVDAYKNRTTFKIPLSEEERIGNKWSRQLIRKMDKDFMSMLDGKWKHIANKTHILRSVYAVTAYQQFQEQLNLSQARFIAQVLGHDTEHSATAYANVRINFGFSKTELDLRPSMDAEKYMSMMMQLQKQVDELRQGTTASQPLQKLQVQKPQPKTASRASFAKQIADAKAAGRNSVIVFNPNDDSEIEIEFNQGRRKYKSPDRIERIRTAVQQLILAGITPTMYRLGQLGYSRRKPYAEDLRKVIIEETK